MVQETYDLLNNGITTVGGVADKIINTASCLGASLSLPLLVVGAGALLFLAKR